MTVTKLLDERTRDLVWSSGKSRFAAAIRRGGEAGSRAGGLTADRSRTATLSIVDEEAITVVVEIPKGSRNKYEMDPSTGHLVLDRTLFTSTMYPAEYGFIEGTLGGDGDTLDALVFVDEPTFPGCRINARAVGLFRMTDEKGRDEKILCVPLHDPMWSRVEQLADLNPNLLNEIEHFFQVYKDLEAKKVDTAGFGLRDEALEVIAAARAAANPRRAGARRGST
jgi:inorganic pyrophosphatase